MSDNPHSKLIDINWQPSPRQLRQFALCLAVLLLIVAWYGVPWKLAVPGAVLALVLSWLKPAALKPVYVVVTCVTWPLGIVIGEIALLTIYFGIFLPIGLLFRWWRRDALQRKLDRSRASYWQECPNEPGKRSYLRRY